MAHSGERIVNPITGERIVFVRPAQETDGECLLMDVELRPGGVIAGAPHRHPFTESFHVTQGRLAGWIAGEGTFSYTAGERFSIPPETDHLVFNAAPGLSRAQVEARPGGDFDLLLETAFDLSAGKRPRGLPRLRGVSELARLMRDQKVMVAFVPDSVQQAVMSLIARPQDRRGARPAASRQPAA